MSEWKEYRFTEAATLTNGRAYLQPELQDAGKYKIVRVGNLSGGDNWFYSDMELPDDKYCHKGDLLYAWACSFGPYIWNEDKTIYHYHIWKVDVNKALTDKYYLYYYLKYYTPKWMGLTNGSVMMHITKGSLEKQIIRLPDLDTQRNIASILSSLDDKIAVNKKICENLEAQAQALFKHWFVDFAPFKDGKFVESELGMIPEGWRVMPIDKVFSIKYGKNLPTSKIEERGKYPVYGANGIMGYYSDYNYNNYVTLITSRGNGSGDISRTYQQKTFITNNSFAVSPKDIYSYLSYAYTYYCIKNINFKPYCSGSAQPQLTNASISAISILLPDEKTIIKYDSLVSLIYNEINRSQSESAKLSILRDTLLPKLMSGQIEI